MMEAESLRLDLRCNACKRRSMPKVGGAFVDLDATDWDGIVFDHVLRCKWCGAADDYTLAHTSLTQVRFGVLGGVTNPDCPIRLGKIRFAKGEQMRRPWSALALLRANAEAAPNDFDGWCRLARTADRFSEHEIARDAYMRWAELTHGLEPLTRLAALEFYHGPIVPHLLPALEALPKHPDREERRSFAATLFEIVRTILEELDGPLSLFGAWKGEGRNVVHASTLDLRRVVDWERLSGFADGGGV